MYIRMQKINLQLNHHSKWSFVRKVLKKSHVVEINISWNMPKSTFFNVKSRIFELDKFKSYQNGPYLISNRFIVFVTCFEDFLKKLYWSQIRWYFFAKFIKQLVSLNLWLENKLTTYSWCPYFNLKSFSPLQKNMAQQFRKTTEGRSSSQYLKNWFFFWGQIHMP